MKIPSSEVALKAMVVVLDMMLKICNSKSYIIVFDFENLSAAVIALGFTILKKFLTLATVSLYSRLEPYLTALMERFQICLFFHVLSENYASSIPQNIFRQYDASCRTISKYW